MKKRLLITSALMTAVLGASLATGTYAWYQVSSGTTALPGTAATGNVNTATNAYSAGNVTFTPALSMGTEKPVLTNNSGETYYLLSDGRTEVKDTSENLVKHGSGTVSVTAALSGASGAAQLSDVLPLLDGKTVVVTLTGTDVRFFEEEPSGTSYTGASSISFEYDITAESTAAGIISESFYYAITGKDDTVQNDTATYTITATVTIEETGA